MSDEAARVLPLTWMTEPVPAHLHWIVWCAQRVSEVGYQEVTDADVIAATEAEAVARAQALCPGRKHYFVRQVVEHHEHEHSKENNR